MADFLMRVKSVDLGQNFFKCPVMVNGFCCLRFISYREMTEDTGKMDSR